MRKSRALGLTLMILFCASCLLAAQDENKSAAQNAKTIHAYRVDFSVNELQGGKKVNARHYSMILNSGDRNQIKIGTRVPVSTPQAPLEYMDVGTSISCRVTESSEDVALEVHSDFSNFSEPDQQHNIRPIVRQITLSGATLVSPGKAVMVGSADDPNSDRQFQLEATVTKLR